MTGKRREITTGGNAHTVEMLKKEIDMEKLLTFCRSVTVCVDHSVRGLCVSPYPNHKKGCPNFGKKSECPPQAALIEKLIDINDPVYAIYNKFEFGEHVQRMKIKHPEWSPRQLACCLYWQPGARKQLRIKIQKFFKASRTVGYEAMKFKVVGTPEACGVNVTETMKSCGIELEWPPETYAYQIVLAGTRLKFRKPEDNDWIGPLFN